MKIENIENKLLETDWTIGKVFKWMVVVLLFMTALVAVGNIIGVFGTVVSAPGRVIEKTLQTDNIIESYEWFFDVNASYDARLNQVVQYRDIYNTEQDKDERYRIRTELAAMQQTCRDLATKYNANSEKMNKSIFKGWDLPATLSQEVCN